MKLKLLEIPEEGLDIEGEESVDIDGAPARALLSARVLKAGKDIFIKGEISAGFSLACSRCLKDFEGDMTFIVDLALRPADEASGQGHELTHEELNTGFYRDDEIDLSEITKEQVLLNMPMKPLCSDACKGFCPMCGANRNEQDCGCGVKGFDPRLQALKKYFDKRKE
jgi:uncharacterized protein